MKQVHVDTACIDPYTTILYATDVYSLSTNPGHEPLSSTQHLVLRTMQWVLRTYEPNVRPLSNNHSLNTTAFHISAAQSSEHLHSRIWHSESPDLLSFLYCRWNTLGKSFNMAETKQLRKTNFESLPPQQIGMFDCTHIHLVSMPLAPNTLVSRHFMHTYIDGR